MEKIKHKKSTLPSGRPVMNTSGKSNQRGPPNSNPEKRPKFNPTKHGFPSPSTPVLVRLLDSTHGISFGSSSLRCTSTLSDVRNLMEDGDSSSFVFLNPENGGRVEVRDERHVTVGMYAPKVSSPLDEPPEEERIKVSIEQGAKDIWRRSDPRTSQMTPSTHHNAYPYNSQPFFCDFASLVTGGTTTAIG